MAKRGCDNGKMMQGRGNSYQIECPGYLCQALRLQYTIGGDKTPACFRKGLDIKDVALKCVKHEVNTCTSERCLFFLRVYSPLRVESCGRVPSSAVVALRSIQYFWLGFLGGVPCFVLVHCQPDGDAVKKKVEEAL